LNIGTVTTAPSTTVAAGNIISQDPAGNTPVPLGTRVNLIVSLGTISLTGLSSIVVEPANAIILVGEQQAFEGQGTYYTGLGVSAGIRGGNYLNLHVLPEGSSIWLTPSISPKLGGFSFEAATVQQVDWAQTAKGKLADFQRKGYGTLDCLAGK